MYILLLLNHRGTVPPACTTMEEKMGNNKGRFSNTKSLSGSFIFLSSKLLLYSGVAMYCVCYCFFCANLSKSLCEFPLGKHMGSGFLTLLRDKVVSYGGVLLG